MLNAFFNTRFSRKSLAGDVEGHLLDHLQFIAFELKMVLWGLLSMAYSQA